MALAALGVFLGRGAQAETIVDFDTSPGLGNNAAVPQTFGDNAAASSEGVTVVGFGTQNIDLTWQATGAQWQYYIDSVWSGVQLDSSEAGDSHELVFTPNNAAVRAIVKSFNFHPYYDDPTESYDYTWQVRAGATVLTSGTLSFIADATKNHPVTVNYTGAPGQALTLALMRTGGTNGTGHASLSSQNIAVDDIVFDQLPTSVLPVGPQVASVMPADAQTGVPAIYSYFASISNGDTALAAGSVQLKLDGTLVSPPPTVSPAAGGITNVRFQAPGLLASGSIHTYTLTYNDTGVPAANYTKEVRFTVAPYPTLPANYANPAGTATTPGFTYRTVLAAGAPTLASTLVRAKAQLAGTLVNPDTQELFENGAEVGPNSDGSFNVDTVLDFDDDGVLSGNFDKDAPFPGLSTGANNWFSTEAWLFLDLPAGYHRLGVNSDDGFEVSVGTPAQGAFTAQTVLGFFDNGRGAADTLFDFLVQTSGLYRFRVIFFESTGSASCEFFSVNLATDEREMILINDLANSKAIKSYRALAGPALPPRITSITRSGQDVTIQWIDGTAPFQVQFSTTLNTAGWSNMGAPTANRTVIVPIQPGAGFVRVAGQ